jgi:uncharacterized membrane protein SirB2
VYDYVLIRRIFATRRREMTDLLPFLVLHVTCAVTSPVLFSMRAWRSIRGLDPAQGFLRVTPHVVDTVLVLAGLLLASLVRQWPFVNAWLTAKLFALLAYIGIGHYAVRRAQTRSARIAAWLLALAVLAYVFAVALTRDPRVGLVEG